MCEVRDLRIHIGRGLTRERDGGPGDAAGPPGGQVPSHHPRPGLGQAVAELEGFADVGLAGLGRHPDGDGELGDGELRHERRAFAGDGDRLVAEPVARGVLDGVGRVHGRPLHGRLQEAGLGGICDYPV